ncbi:MAG: DUF4214 domain-containing protein, partial [Lachnospiraceae bacterium]|nr:DUF4214 domain-containing protein [Lachnospiraceae bacterium]
GSVDIGNLALEAGTALLSVTDASSAAQSVKGAAEDEMAFVAASTNPAVVLTDYANSQGMQVADVLNISLDNVIYRGSRDLNDAWRIPLGADDPLDNPVHVDLELDGDIASSIDSNDVKILSIDPDGNVMELEGGFDPEKNVLFFDTDYFSTIAIATGGADDHLQDQINLLNHLYDTLLGRTGDEGGMNNWIDQLQAHTLDGANLIYGFLNSPEFQAKEMTDAEYVRMLYEALLGRTPSDEEVAGWVTQLEAGKTRLALSAGFVNSPEFKALYESIGVVPGKMFEDGTPYNAAYRLLIEHFYAASLGREPDESGINDWVERMNAQDLSIEGLLLGFLNSPEYLGFELTDEQFVDNMYLVCIGREPDAAGKATWLADLAAGVTRDNIARGFLGSKEFGEILDSLGL